MAFKSVITIEKPLQHIGLADWHARVNKLRDGAYTRRMDAFKLRYGSRTIRNETRIGGDWINYESNEALSHRINELNQWRTEIGAILQRINREVELLRIEKDTTERELEAMQTPISVVAECLTMRDCRLGSELTYDDADTELKKELALIESNQQLLIDQCQSTWEKLNRLDEIGFKLNLEVDNKEEAADIDVFQISLNKFAANITFKPDATRNPRNCCSYESWLAHTENMRQLAESELANTYSIRESLFVCREKCKNSLKCQQERTDHNIRKRIFETQRSRNELEWQKFKMNEEMERAICEIKNLEQALRDKTDAMKLAQTRLENRAQRSGMELCTDGAHQKICEEVNKMNEIRRQLNNQIDASKTNYNLLEQMALKIDVDLENKQHSLMTDLRAVDLRVRLYSKDKPMATAQTERNIELTQMEKEIPKEY